MNAQTLLPLPIDMSDELADALDQALDFLASEWGENHPAITRLQAPLCRYNVATAQAHIRSQGVRQWIGGSR